MRQRLGRILIDQGILQPLEVERLLEIQSQTCRPVGLLAEELFGIAPRAIEQAWARQYCQGADRVDPMGQRIQTRAIESIDRRQAWQFGVLPLRFDGPDLVVATTEQNLVRALRFVSRCLSVPCYLVLADAGALGEALSYYYSMAGLDGGALGGGNVLARALL